MRPVRRRAPADEKQPGSYPAEPGKDSARAQVTAIAGCPGTSAGTADRPEPSSGSRRSAPAGRNGHQNLSRPDGRVTRRVPRKVRAPQGRTAGNAGPGQPGGKATESRPPRRGGVRVKGWRKRPPAPWVTTARRPRPEQARAARERPAPSARVGRLRPLAIAALDGWPSPGPGQGQNPAYRLAQHADVAQLAAHGVPDAEVAGSRPAVRSARRARRGARAHGVTRFVRRPAQRTGVRETLVTVAVAQMVRAPACQAGNRGFESRRRLLRGTRSPMAQSLSRGTEHLRPGGRARPETSHPGEWRNWHTRWSQVPVVREDTEGSNPSLLTLFLLGE